MLEELIGCFDMRLAITALGASSCAIAIARISLGSATDFRVEAIPVSGAGTGLLFLTLGIAAALAGMAYVRTIMGALSLTDRLRLPAVWRAASIGALIGTLGWLVPGALGGGDSLTQQALSGANSIAFLAWMFPFGFFWDPYLTRPERQGAYLRLCWFWARNWVYSLLLSAAWPPLHSLL